MKSLKLSSEAINFLKTVLESVQLRASDPDLENLAKVTAEIFRELNRVTSNDSGK